MDIEEFNPESRPTDRRFINLTGRQFGHLTVIGFFSRRGAHRLWLCMCRCRRVIVVYAANLAKNHTQSCGCLKAETKANFRHGGYFAAGLPSPEYVAYTNAKSRCQNPKCHSYKWYGAAGVQFRFDDFPEFLRELGPRPSADHSIDRIDPATQQANNKRRRHV